MEIEDAYRITCQSMRTTFIKHQILRASLQGNLQELKERTRDFVCGVNRLLLNGAHLDIQPTSKSAVQTLVPGLYNPFRPRKGWDWSTFYV